MGLSALGAREPVPGYRQKMALCSHLGYHICKCVHSYSDDFAALLDAILKHELNSNHKAVDCPRTNKNGVAHRDPVIIISPYPSLDPANGYLHRARILPCMDTWTNCVFTLMPSEHRTLGHRARAGTKYGRCLKFMFITCFLPAVQKVFIISHKQQEDRRLNCR